MNARRIGVVVVSRGLLEMLLKFPPGTDVRRWWLDEDGNVAIEVEHRDCAPVDEGHEIPRYVLVHELTARLHRLET